MPFTSHDKTIIRNKLNEVKDKKILREIYDILEKDPKFSFTSNNNGVFFNIALLNENTLIELKKILLEHT